MGHSQAGVVERSGGYGVLNHEGHMIRTTRQRTLKAGTWIWSAVLLAAFAVSFVTIQVLAARTAGGYPTPPFFHFFFSDTIHMKAWLATGAIVLALFQALTGARLFEIVHFAPYGRFWNHIHRGSGYLAILLTLPVAYHCIFLLGFETTTVRVTVHSLLGSAFYGAFLGKVIVVRSGAFPGWALPVAGALLFAILFGLWATSSLYLFSRNPLTL